MEKIILSQLIESKSVHEDLLMLVGDIDKAAKEIVKCFKRGGKLYVFGNGGSAADAQHFVAELINLPAISLVTNASTLTAIGNDFAFESIFSKQVAAVVTDKDLVIGITTSGNSKNVFMGITEAQRFGARTIVLTGQNDGLIDGMANFTIKVPSNNTARIQEAHILVLHIIAAVVNTEFSKKIKYKYGPETEI